jgi:hypothetical protein
VTACGLSDAPRSSAAPRDWATSRGLETGAPAGPAAVPPANERPGAEDARDDQARTAIWISIALVIVTAIVAVTGVFFLESRRRIRRDARRIEDDVVSRASGDPALQGIRVLVVARPPLWRGPIQLDVGGTVPSQTQRDAVLSIAKARAANARRPVHVNDGVRVAPPGSPPHRGEVA